METKAVSRFVRMSPLKARGLARKLQGLPVAEALRLTDLTAGKPALYIGKTLRTAIASAESKASATVDKLSVKQAVIEEGPRMKRFWQRARGAASPILRRMSHIRIVVTDGVDAAEASG